MFDLLNRILQPSIVWRTQLFKQGCPLSRPNFAFSKLGL